MYPELSDRGPAYDVALDRNRYHQLIGAGLSPQEAQSALTRELTVGRASHLVEIALALGPEAFQKTPYIFDFDYQILPDQNGSQVLFREPLTSQDRVVAMMEEGAGTARGIWQKMAKSIAVGIKKLETLAASAPEGRMFAVVSPAEIAKAYGFVYLYQKIGTTLKGYGIPVWLSPEFLAEFTGLTDRFQLLENPLVLDSRSPQQIFSQLTGLHPAAFQTGLDNYHALEHQIRPEASLDVQFIAQGIGPAVLQNRLTREQKWMIEHTPGFENIAAMINNLRPGEKFNLLLACGLLEFIGPVDAGVNYINSLIIGGESLVTCPVCSEKHGHQVKVYCPPGNHCPECGTLRLCGA